MFYGQTSPNLTLLEITDAVHKYLRAMFDGKKGNKLQCSSPEHTEDEHYTICSILRAAELRLLIRKQKDDM